MSLVKPISNGSLAFLGWEAMLTLFVLDYLPVQVRIE